MEEFLSAPMMVMPIALTLLLENLFGNPDLDQKIIEFQVMVVLYHVGH